MECGASGRRWKLLSLPGACVREESSCTTLRLLKWRICVINKRFYQPDFFKSFEASFLFHQKHAQVVGQKAPRWMLQLMFLSTTSNTSGQKNFSHFPLVSHFPMKNFLAQYFLTQISWERKCYKSTSTFRVKHYLFTDKQTDITSPQKHEVTIFISSFNYFCSIAIRRKFLICNLPVAFSISADV